MIKDTKEGQTHYYEDACYKCESCGSHYDMPIIKCGECLQKNGATPKNDDDIKFLFIFTIIMILFYGILLWLFTKVL